MDDAELERFQDKLLALRNQLRGDIQASIDAVSEEIRPAGEDTNEPSEGLDKELVLEHNEEDIYRAVNAALQRMEEGTFGRCVACETSIPKSRLNAIPYAAYCVDCERDAEQQQ